MSGNGADGETTLPAQVEQVPGQVPEQTPEQVSEKMAEQGPEKVEEKVEEKVPQKGEEKVPDQMEEKVPDQVEEKVPEQVTGQANDWTTKPLPELPQSEPADPALSVEASPDLVRSTTDDSPDPDKSTTEDASDKSIKSPARTVKSWVTATSASDSIRSSTSTAKSWHTMEAEEKPYFMQQPFGLSVDEDAPPRPLSKDSTYASSTLSSRRASVMTTGSTDKLRLPISITERPIKYGTGKFSDVELVPQPSDDPQDPLNWPSWKKNLNYGALLYMGALVGVMKTIYISVNSAVSTRYNVSYTAALSLTAVPLILSALTGLGGMVAAKIWGKRPIYLAATAAIFVGAAWNTADSFGESVVARIFQGLGWGAFDALILGSIQDTFFDHESGFRIVTYHAASVAATWGAPVLGGAASGGATGFSLQFVILNAFLAVGVLLMLLGAPETAFDRTRAAGSPQPASAPQDVPPPEAACPIDATKQYLATMTPTSYKASSVDLKLLLQAPRAILAPTNLLLVVEGLPPNAGLWGLASSLSLLFSAAPFDLSVPSVGALLAGPFIMGTSVATALALPAFTRRFTPKVHVAMLAAASAVAVTGVLALGLYVDECLQMSTASVWTLGSAHSQLSFPAVSVLLGLLAAGSLALDAAWRPAVQRSADFTSSNLAVGRRTTADMAGGLACWRALLAGLFVAGLPGDVGAGVAAGLRMTVLGLGLGQILVAGLMGVVWWRWHEGVWRLDGRVMGLVDWDRIKRGESFFDYS